MTSKAAILKVIREKCLDCCCGSTFEVKNCQATLCKLYPYRMGYDPTPSKKGFAGKIPRIDEGKNGRK